MLDFLEVFLLLVIIGLLIGKSRPQSKKGFGRELILDSCALMDGRIRDLVTSGFVMRPLVVPQFIIAEMQLLADGNDRLKRERARGALDLVAELQADKDIPLRVEQLLLHDPQPADDKLVMLAQKLKADLYTTDFNLGKVAAIAGVKVLNINELAHAVRPPALPGEHKEVTIVQIGSNRKQGVGYLDDGTMVVVDGAASRVGQTVSVDVVRMHQTVAGKMIFANLASQKNGAAPVAHRRHKNV